MKNQDTKFYITTPIYYVTAKPHLGSLYSTLLADVIARWKRLSGKNIFFLTGTDEHGQKIAQAAAKVSMEPKAFVDSFINNYKDLWKRYQLDYTYFIRTTDTAHVQAVQKWLTRLIEKGDIYKSFYEGWYCTQCESFALHDHTDLSQPPPCPSCGRETAVVAEESYFFKLSAYQDRLLDFYASNPDFIVPKERFKEVINFVKEGLQDLSISRTTITWGIPFPGDDNHVTYVWADALNNYITAIGYEQSDKEKDYSYWWPADVHVLGKDIIRFHAVYWPAFLMASDLALPKQLLVHGWIKVADEKMSKSRSNSVDPQELADVYGVDQVRYYLIRHFSIGQDSNFALEDVEQRINADLANDLGNLLNRMTTLAEKNDVFSLPPPQQISEATAALERNSKEMVRTCLTYMSTYSLHLVVAEIWKFIAQANAFFHNAEPWKLAKTDKNALLEVLWATCSSLRMIASLAWPFMPSSMEHLLNSLGTPLVLDGTDVFAMFVDQPWNQLFTIQKIPVLFNKIESKKQEELAQEVIPADTTIAIDEFAKIELRVGTIEACDTIPKSDKLYKLQVNFGDYGMRQVLSGIRAFFQHSDLVGKQVVFVFNLKPRKMMGLESQGMILTAKDAQGAVHLITPQTLVPNGTKLQ